ncbi:unnamed protein product [Aureobasidium vineae]|uniref:Uncharacterized protein n=1 Tax=Aureobasidium vineae TaxID=2773715 RepID=A0A9N8JNZ9_9PEZI|nr:unnamed protein product [Aureobasidium vineae]
MPFLRQAHGLRLRLHPWPLTNNPALYPSTVRFASHSNRYKKNHAAQDSPAKARSDQNDTASSKRQKPFWKSIVPDFLSQEMDASSRKGGHFAQVSSFKLHTSHKSGSKPTVEASTTSWDSKTNQVGHTVYDPISGRMVPANNQTRQTSTSTKGQLNNQSSEKAYQKPMIVSQLPDDIEVLANTPTTHASFTEDFGKTYQSEHDELLAARRHLDTLREQIQILERQAHPDMIKPHYAVDAERPAVFEDGWDNNPQGLQTAFEHEKEACEHGDMKPLEQEMNALNKRSTQEINDEYSVAPSGMETHFANEQKDDELSHKSSLEQELVAMNIKAPPLDDGCSASPQGLETLFEHEQKEAEQGARETLEDEVRATGIADGLLQYTDSFAKEPAGLETMYHREQQGMPQRLAHELENMASGPAVRDPDDAYSTEPIGMQTLYQREAEGSQKGQHKDLEHGLHDHIQARNLNDSFLANLEGMQTLWKREQEDVERGSAKSLEEEIRAQKHASTIANEYNTSPFGMETHFANEMQNTGDGKSETLEEEVSRRVQAQVPDDGHARSPSGLETAFDREQKDTMLGKRQSLEKEIDNREPAFEDGYATMPMGLQMMFRREKQSRERSLEEDIKQEASYHEDGYSRAPIGMENSFEREAKDESTSLEADLKNMPGEGDLSPTVGKFNNSNMWYKQPARSTFSEEYPKADVKELDQHTAFFGRSLDEGSSNPIESSVSSPETVTAAEHISSTTAPDNISTNASSTPESDPKITWAEPALYKVIAYDSSKDVITITTTPSSFSDSEIPISIPRAITQLAQTARFLPHLASAQNDGYQVIQADKDFLISRKVHAESRSRPPLYDGHINPVDGTSKHIPIEPPSARFASPTGFVNYEPIFPTEPVYKQTNATSPPSDIPMNGHPEFQQQTYYPFPHEVLHSEQRRNGKSYIVTHRERQRRERRRRWRRRIVWGLSVAAGTAVSTAYVVGVSGELARPEKPALKPTK